MRPIRLFRLLLYIKADSNLNDNPVDESILDAPPGFQPRTNHVHLLVDLFQQHIYTQNFESNPERSSSSQLIKLTFPIKIFKFLQPYEFKGIIDPVEAKIWLREIEKIFEIFGVEDDKKTIFAT